ncbi:MAG: PAS domain-containing protein, partial [SAR324 cluster bacterium]|nr:PAS domain-containing protein [SAR324 cluster bacterium]
MLADGQHILDLKRKGDIFGEMSVISQKPCTASIITKEQTRVFSIKSQSIGAYSDLNSDELNNTLYRLFAMILTDKLSMTTHKAREYERTKNELLLEVIVRKQKEAALRENEERLALTLRGTNAGLWDWYIKSGKTVFNERWAEIIGYTLKELEPVSIDTWIKYTHPDDFKKSNELLKKHFSGELGFYECEVRMQHKNGEWVWVLDRGMISEWDQEGNPVRVTGTHIEITDRINKEEQIKASLLGKRKAEERAYLAQKMALFAQAFPFPILSIDNTGKIETANRAAALAFQKVVVGLNFSDLFPNLTDSFLDEIRQSGRVFFINISIRSRYYLFTFQMVKQFDVVHVFGTDI